MKQQKQQSLFKIIKIFFCQDQDRDIIYQYIIYEDIIKIFIQIIYQDIVYQDQLRQSLFKINLSRNSI